MFHRFTLAVLLVTGFATSLSMGMAAGAPAAPDTSDQAAIRDAAGWIGRENKVETEYRYVMTCKVRFVFFWGGRDDVGVPVFAAGLGAVHPGDVLVARRDGA